MFGIGKSADSSKRTSNNESHLPLLGSDKKNDDNQCERLFVKIKSGDSSEIEIDIVDTETVNDLKARLTSKLNTAGKRVRLIASGRLLEPGNMTLISDFKIQPGAFIHVVISENRINQSVAPNSSSSSDSTAGAPTATNYRGLDQLNAGQSYTLVTQETSKNSMFVTHRNLC